MLVVVVLGTADLGSGFGGRAASFVDPVVAWAGGLQLVALARRRYQMRTRTGCPPAKSVASRCWPVSMNLSKLCSRTNSLVRHGEFVMSRSL